MIVGDINQNSLFALAEFKKFYEITYFGIFERFTLLGIPIIILRIRYRIYPDISYTVNQLFYEGSL